jgi:hypothetical protein
MSYKSKSGLDDVEQQCTNYLPCRYCGKSTLVATLSQYGARCFSCFEKYCSMTPAEIKAEYERGIAASRVRA